MRNAIVELWLARRKYFERTIFSLGALRRGTAKQCEYSKGNLC